MSHFQSLSPATQPRLQLAFHGISLLSETIPHVSVEKYFDRRLQQLLQIPLHVSSIFLWSDLVFGQYCGCTFFLVPYLLVRLHIHLINFGLVWKISFRFPYMSSIHVGFRYFLGGLLSLSSTMYCRFRILDCFVGIVYCFLCLLLFNSDLVSVNLWLIYCIIPIILNLPILGRLASKRALQFS